MNREIAVVEPEHHRREGEALRPEPRGERVDKFGERQDAAAADEPFRLHGERDEGAKGDEPKQAEEQELGLPISNAATGVQTHEMILEANYNIHVYRGVDFRPEFQYVFRPNA